MKIVLAIVFFTISVNLFSQETIKVGCGYYDYKEMQKLATSISKIIGYNNYIGVDSTTLQTLYGYGYIKENDSTKKLIIWFKKVNEWEYGVKHYKGIVYDKISAPFDDAVKIYTEFLNRKLPSDFLIKKYDKWEPLCNIRGKMIITFSPDNPLGNYSIKIWPANP